MDTQAFDLNQIIEKENTAVFQMLSDKGKEIFFPKGGILAQAALAKGKEINATIGEAIADDGRSMYLPGIKERLSLEIEDIFPYAPSLGKADLRQYWKSSIYKKNPGVGTQPISLPIVTCGLTHAISMAAYMFLNPGDTVIMPDLYWENYNLIFEKAAGAKIVSFNLFRNGAFDTEALADAIAKNPSNRVYILLNFPNNPTGYTPTNDEADKIAAVIKSAAEAGKNIAVLIDDAYFGLVFEKDIYKESIFSKLANIHERVLAVKMDGATKEDYVWGFRVGFISYAVKGGTPSLYAAMEEKTGGALRSNISNVSNMSQSLLYREYMSDGYDIAKKEKFDILKARYDAMKKCLAENDYSECYKALPYNSGYFMCVQVADGIDPEAVRMTLLNKYSTGIIVFGTIIRLAFSAVPESKISKLLDNLYRACLDNK